MINRLIESKLKELITKFPIVTLTGPRQSGKTTICKETFKNYEYLTLESLDHRQEAIEDPRGFLNKFKEGVILDEIQRTPDLTSYIQEYVDSDTNKKRKYILTGSQQFEVTNSINQSLAGRTALLRLLPFSYEEIYSEVKGIPSIAKLIYTGFYPRIHDQQINPTDALSAYVSTYIERDVRSISNIKNMNSFERFLGLCAANVGCLLDYTRLSNDVGVDQETIKSWISVLEASYICFTLKPHLTNYRKRLTKSPKLYFYDVGLASYLIGIREESQLENHPLRGNLFENYVVADLLKSFWHRGDYRNLFFFRDSSGNEVDILFEQGAKVSLIEVKSGKTLSKEQFKGLEFYKKMKLGSVLNSYLVYGGENTETKYENTIIPRSCINEIIPY